MSTKSTKTAFNRYVIVISDDSIQNTTKTRLMKLNITLLRYVLTSLTTSR